MQKIHNETQDFERQKQDKKAKVIKITLVFVNNTVKMVASEDFFFQR